MISGKAEVTANTGDISPPFQEATPPFSVRECIDRKSTGGKARLLARRKGRPSGSRKQSPVVRCTASGTPSTESQHWPETTSNA